MVGLSPSVCWVYPRGCGAANHIGSEKFNPLVLEEIQTAADTPNQHRRRDEEQLA